MENNFDLRKFLTEGKLTSNSKLLKEDFPPSPNSNIPDANAEDFDVATAFKKARVDMSKPVSVMYHYDHGKSPDETKEEMSAEAAVKKLEAERQENRKNFTDDGEEVPSDIHGYEFENYSVLEKHMPEGHEYKLSYYLDGDYTYSVTQEKSGVSEEVNEQLASQAIQEFIAADNNGVSIAEFVKAIIDGAAEFNQEDAAYQDLDKRSEVILKAIGRQDLIGGTNETAPGYMHDCAAKVMHEKYGNGDCIPEQHTLVKEGTKYVVTHYDVLFESGKTVKNIPVGELKIITESHHGHKRRKK